MLTKEQLRQIEEDPRFQSLKTDNPALAAKVARLAARKVVQGGMTTGRDPEIRSFLERNLPAVQGMKGGVEEEISAFPETALKSFTGYSAIGQVGKGAKDILTGAPVEQQEPIDTRLTGAYQALKAGRIGEAGRNLASYGRDKSSYYMPGTLAAGTVGLFADITGQIPDIVTGAKLAGTAAQGLMRTGLPQRAAGVLSQGGVDAAMQFAGTLAATRDPEAALRAAGFGGALGSGVGYLAPAAPTAATQRVITERARMRKPTSPALNQNLVSETERAYYWPDIAKPAQVSTRESRRAAQVGLPRPMVAAIESQQGPSVIYRPPGQGPVEINPAWMPGGQPVPNVAAARTMAQESLDMQRRMAAAAPFEQMEGRGPRLLPPPSGEPVMPQVPPRPPAPGEAALYGVAPPNVSDIIRARQEAEAAYNAIRNAPPPDPADPMGIYRAGFEQVALNRLNDFREQEQAAIARTLADAQTREARAAAAATQAQAAQQTEAARLAGPSTIANDPMWDPRVREAMAAALPPRSAFRQAYPTSAEIAARPDPMADPTVQAALRAALPPGSPILGNLPTPSAVQPPAPMMPPSRQLQPPSGAMVPPVADISGAPRYVAQAPMAGAEEALMGQIGARQVLPSTRQELEAIASAAANERFALQQQLNALTLPEKATKAQIAQRNATEMQLREGIIAAGERQMQALQRLGSLPAEAPAPRVSTPVEPPPAPVKGKKKPLTDLADTPLGRLMLGEEGMATPTGALGALGAPVAAALGTVYRGILTGANAAQRAVASNQFRQLAEIPRLIPQAATTVGKYVSDNMPPTLKSAIATVKAAPGASATGLYNFVAARSPNTARTLDAMGRFFITNYGKPAAYIELEEAAAQAGRQIQNDLANFGIKVFDTVGDDAARMRRLHADMTAENYRPGSNRVDNALVMEGRKLTGDVGAHLVRVGALTPQAYAKWGSRYLPRIYAKYLAAGKDAEALGVLQRLFDNDPGLSGYYLRGLKETVSQSEAAARVGTGQWEIIPGSQKKNGDVDVWRDWTQAERDKWGEVRNVAAALQKYATQASNEIKNGTFLEGIRTGKDANGAWAIDASTQYTNPRQRPAEFTTSSGQRYVYVGDSARKGGSIKKFGTLSDHYVRDDIYQHLRFQAEFGGFKQITRGVKKYTGINLFKKLVTIGNPSYFMNNFFVNIPQLVLGGGAISDLPLAASLIASRDKLVEDLVRLGVIQDGMALRQLSQRVNPILKQAGAGATHSPGQVSVALDRVSNAVSRYETAGYNISNASDDLFRVALVKGLMDRQKMTLEQAAEVAKTTFYNREAVTAPFVDVMEAAQIPFYGVTHWTLGTLPKMMWENPAKAAYLASIAYLGTTVPEMIYGVEPEVAEARRKLLPPPMQGRFGLMFPNAVFTGYDEYGQPKFTDVGTWNPATGATAEVPIGPAQSFPRALSPGGPITALAQLAANYDFYTGKKIVPIESGQRTAIDETLLSKIPGVGTYAPQEVRAFLGRAFIPGMVRQPYEAAREVAAQTLPPETAVSLGLTGGEAVPVGLGTRLKRMTGIKERPINMLEMFARNEGIKERKLSELRRSQAATYRRYERAANAGNEAEAEAALQKWSAYNLMIQSVEMEETAKQMETLPALE